MCTDDQPAERRRPPVLWLGLKFFIPPSDWVDLPPPALIRHTKIEGAFIGFVGPAAAHLSGRFALRPDGVVCAWSGSAATVNFVGTGVSATISDSGMNRFLVIVDGEPLAQKLRGRPGRRTVELVSGLQHGEHRVTLYRLTEALLGETTIHGFRLSLGGLPQGEAEECERQILLIGDSISAAYGNEGEGPETPFTPDTQNHYWSYGAMAGRALDAGVTTVAWSGKGVFSNRGSTVDTVTMADLWTRTLPAARAPEPAIHCLDQEPDVVVINLGTNDFAEEVKDLRPFGPAYGHLMDAVRARYPKAHIFAAVSPTLNDRWPTGRASRSIMHKTLKALVGARRARGDRGVHLLSFAEIPAHEGFGCQWHPTTRTHVRMAEELRRAVEATLAW